ncbi:MAG: YceI family protein [Pirellulaceae bacterium]|nr:YceI family protein [Pirellulaceae bacterium]
MRFAVLASVLGMGALLLGCADSPPVSDTGGPNSGVTAGGTPEVAVDTGAPMVEAGTAAPDDSAGTAIVLSPENTSIKFIGNHTGDDPQPRLGSFQQFNGKAIVDGTLKSVQVEIETASLTTEIEKLTNHLKNADFFDVNQFPKAAFQSTAINDQGDGTVEITGDLTLLDSTHSVTFPATVNYDGGLKLRAEFELDRTVWGMNFGLDKIEKMVPMTITVGG